MEELTVWQVHHLKQYYGIKYPYQNKSFPVLWIFPTSGFSDSSSSYTDNDDIEQSL